VSKKIWIYLEDWGTFKRFSVDDPRLVFGAIGTEYGEPKLSTRGKWSYVPYGDTKEECAARANKYTLKKIADLQEKLDELKSELVVP
jgi:hypothetical protein